MEVELFDGTILEFPDNTPEAAINAAAKRETARIRSRMNAQQKYSATDGMSTADKFFAGAGKAVVDTGRGLRQIGAEIGNAVGLVDDSTVAALRAGQDEVNARDAELMQTGAGVAGNIAGTVATMYGGGAALRAPSLVRGLANNAVVRGMSAAGQALTAPQKLGGAMGAGVATGAIQPVGENDSRTLNAALGGLAGGVGQGIAAGAGKIAQPFRRPTAVDAKAIRTLQAEGVPLDAAQKSGSTMLKRVKAGLSDNIVTAGRQAEAFEAQAAAYNRAVLKSIGVSADRADESVMAAARSRIVKDMDDVLGKYSIRPSKGGLNQIEVIAARSKRQIGDNNPIMETVADIKKHVADYGQIDGAFYRTLRQDLGVLEGDPQSASLARELREGLDEAFQRVAGKDGPKLLQARREYRNLKLIEGAIDREGGGNISPAKLANAFGTKKNRNVSIYGKGDQSVVSLSRLAKAGKRVLQEKLPNSGTTARALAQFGGSAGVGAIAGYANTGDPSAAIYGGLAGIAAPMAASRAVNSPALGNYFSQGIQSQVPRNALAWLSQQGLLRTVPIAVSQQ